MIALNFVSIRQFVAAFAIKLDEFYFCACILAHTNCLNAYSIKADIFWKTHVLHLLPFQNDDVFNKTSVPHY